MDPINANPVLVQALRGGAVESMHRGAVAVLDAEGTVHTALGDIDRPIFPRSAGIPSMTVDDRMTMNQLVAGVAARNGYEAIRYYPTGGSSTDWMYATYKVPSILMEIGEYTGEVSRFYPPAAAMASEVAGNRDAILWLIGEADCPSEAAGLGGRRCGPRFDDFEREAGWVVNPDGTDSATSGALSGRVAQSSR